MRQVLLDIGHQEALAVCISGQAVGARPDRNRSQDRMCRGVNDEELARPACRCKDQTLLLCHQHPAGLRTAGDCHQVAQLRSIYHLDAPGRRIGDEDLAVCQRHIPVIEVAFRVRWQVKGVA